MKEQKGKYQSKMPGMPQGMPMGHAGMPMKPEAERPKIDLNKLKDKLESFKKNVVKKYNFVLSLSILSPNAAPLFEEDEALPKEVIDSKPIHLLMIIPEEQYKNIPKIKPEVVKFVKDTGENLWINIKTPVDLWNYGLDSKFEFLDAISGSFPLYDQGFLGALKVANIHKTLCLGKFDKYVTSYVIAGSLVRGTADKDSDVDVFIVIDDTDVKRMGSLELLERLRGMIYDYIREATALAGVKNILNTQVYLLTNFWESVKDAHPVMFTFIRDGIPLYDRGTFIPWKRLLQKGKIKPSPEAIDQYMKQGAVTDEIVKKRLLDVMVDIYYGVVTPTQAMMMLAGEAPPVPKEIVSEVKKVLVEREKVMSSADLKTIEKAVTLFKNYEYGKLKEFSGTEIDAFMKEMHQFNKALNEIRKNLEKKAQSKSAEEIYEEVFKLLATLFGKGSQNELINKFEKNLAAKGKVSPRFVNILKEIVNIKKKLKAGKLTQREVDKSKRDAYELITSLVEYAQRKDIIKTQKDFIEISYQGRKAELVLMGEANFLVEGNVIKKFSEGKLVKSDKREFEAAIAKHKEKIGHKIPGEIFMILEKEIGKFELVL